jgi:hypothetical protein
MARARRVTLFEREIRERLSEAAVELLLGGARVLSEGEVAPGGRFYGSTMLTLDLGAVSAAFRERCDAAAARRVASMMAADARVARRVRAVAEREAATVAGARVKLAASDLRVRAQGALVHIDVDLEGAVAR